MVKYIIIGLAGLLAISIVVADYVVRYRKDLL
jgi:uncharacterized membrane protein YuzA (DUF378 family)